MIRRRCISSPNFNFNIIIGESLHDLKICAESAMRQGCDDSTLLSLLHRVAALAAQCAQDRGAQARARLHPQLHHESEDYLAKTTRGSDEDTADR